MSCPYLTSQPYPGYNPHELHDHIFVPLPTLHRHYILRQTYLDEDEGEGENEDGERGGRRAGNRDKEHMVDIEDGKAIVHIEPFLRFPRLKHHAHPFFVIFNALPKLRKRELQLRPEHRAMLTLMEKIEDIWMSKSNIPIKTEIRPKMRESGRGVGKVKGKARGLNRPKVAQRIEFRRRRHLTTPSPTSQSSTSSPTSRSSTPSPTSRSSTVFLFDDHSEVAGWAERVAAAGLPEVTDEAVIWPDEEPVRSPIQKWDRWHIPYKQAEFCSSDWPMFLYSFALWMPQR